ncbi:Electron transport complex protein RnfE [hydrothermal vent metagenome]|uniref:Electron transport complex protein RnfE n=1 Tax=hydrothermal vent metagenome TaxID=652676 RepID=A0A3B1BQH3_9ZZZZ
MKNPYLDIARNGLWSNNSALVQVLGLCPMLAITNTMVNSLGLGLATTLTLICSNVSISAIRHWVRPEIRIPVFVLIIASIVTVIELSMNAWFHELYNILGIFIPLIVTNCMIIARAEAFASKNSIPQSFADGLFMGLGFTLVLLLLGTLREAIGFGTLFQQIELMFGEHSKWLTVHLFQNYRGYLLAILPPGAFLGLGFLIAIKNRIEKYHARKTRAIPTEQVVEVIR